MMKKKTICFLIKSHFSHTPGGAELHTNTIIDALIKDNEYNILYLCKNYDKKFTPEGYKIIDVNTFFGKLFSQFDIVSLFNKLIKISPDIIYQKGAHSYSGVAAFYAKIFGRKFIWHISSDNNVIANNKYYQKLYRSKFDQILLKYAINNATTIIGQTKIQDKLLRLNYGRSCQALIPPGHAKINGNITKPRRVRVIWIGNFRKVKRPELFIRLVKELNWLNDISFVMIGGFVGKSTCYCHLIDEMKSLNRFKYLGQLSQNEVNKNLEESHILVNTSKYEGFSNTFVQAWLREVPVVSLSVDPDGILTNKKIGINSMTFKNLIEDVEMLYRDKTLRDQMGTKARKFAEVNFSDFRMIKNLKKHFIF